jgi:TonB family protein
MRALVVSVLLVVCACLVPGAHADEAAIPSPVLEPPVLETFQPAVLPEGSESASGQVGLLLSIDASGHVTEAAVESSLSPVHDEAARAAVLRFVFKPATRNGAPVPARVRYHFQFAPPELEPLPPAPPRLGSLSGQVTDNAQGAPLVGADLSLMGADGLSRAALTDAQGRFVFAELPEGTYELQIVALDHEPHSAQEVLAAGDQLELAYRLRPVSAAAAAEFGAVARVEAPSREVIRRSVAAEELTRMAGTRGDPLRTVELLPGVARPPVGAGMLLVRGSAPGDSEVFLDGAPIYGLYHFGGLTSVVNGHLLKGIDLYPGNFSVRYGRKTGGVIDTSFRDPRADGVHGLLDVNTIDASLLVEAPITDQLSFAIAARRSYMDVWFKSIVENSSMSVMAAPVYYDYQSILSWKPGSRDRIRLIGYGSYDELTLLVNDSLESDPSVRGRFGNTNSFHRAQLEWHRDYREGLDSDFSVGAGPVLANANFGPDLGYDVRGFDVISRGEVRWRVLPRLRLNLGMDTQIAQTQLAFHGPAAQQSEGDPSTNAPITGREQMRVDTTGTFARPAAYLELVGSPLEWLELTAGARVDYFSELAQLTVDPRLNARVLLGATTLRAGVGLFSQPPDFTQTIAGYGNPDLGPIHALHLGAGVEQRLGAQALVSLDGFYKDLSDLIVNGDAPGELVNRGDGRIYGLEAMGRMNPGGRFSGFLSYTLSRSERNDRDGEGYRLFDYDQTHILTASGNLKLGRGWLLGTTFRLASGNPYTPIKSGLYNANHDLYQPLYGATNSQRSGYFHRLDVRVEKRWALGDKGAGITTYLDLQNAYNRLNPEGAQYNFDYSKTKTVPGMPIIPSIGLRGEL